MLTIEEKIARAERVDLHYRGPYETKYAIVEYYCRQGKPLRVASYYQYGEELKSSNPLICWNWVPSTNFVVLEDGFGSEEDAKLRLKELKSELKGARDGTSKNM
jgi:hypothetical protein